MHVPFFNKKEETLVRLLRTIGIWLMILSIAAATTACKPSGGGETTSPSTTSSAAGEATTPLVTAEPATSAGTTAAPANGGETTAAPGTTTAETTSGAATETTGANASTAVPATAVATTGATATTSTGAGTTSVPPTTGATTAPTSAPTTTAAGQDGRVTYSTSFEPVYTIADITEVGPPISRQFLLPEIYTGNVTINFDMTTPGRSHDWMVGFVSEAMVSEFKYYTQMSIQVAMNSFNIQAINGNDFVRFDTLVLGAKYHVRIEANMNAHTYNAYITAPGAAEAMVGAGNFAFRTKGQNPVDTRVSQADNIAMMVVGGAKDNQGFMENFTITDDTP